MCPRTGVQILDRIKIVNRNVYKITLNFDAIVEVTDMTIKGNIRRNCNVK